MSKIYISEIIAENKNPVCSQIDEFVRINVSGSYKDITDTIPCEYPLLIRFDTIYERAISSIKEFVPLNNTDGQIFKIVFDTAVKICKLIRKYKADIKKLSGDIK